MTNRLAGQPNGNSSGWNLQGVFQFVSWGSRTDLPSIFICRKGEGGGYTATLTVPHGKISPSISNGISGRATWTEIRMVGSSCFVH